MILPASCCEWFKMVKGWGRPHEVAYYILLKKVCKTSVSSVFVCNVLTFRCLVVKQMEADGNRCFARLIDYLQ